MARTGVEVYEITKTAFDELVADGRIGGKVENAYPGTLLVVCMETKLDGHCYHRPVVISGGYIDMCFALEDADFYAACDLDTGNYNRYEYEVWDIVSDGPVIRHIVSVDNGAREYDLDDDDDWSEFGHMIMREPLLWDALVNAMDDDAREKTHAEFQTEGDTWCIRACFMQEYLRNAPCDLVIG